MRPCSEQIQLQRVAVRAVDRQPVRLDMALPKAAVSAEQFVAVVLFLQRLLPRQRVDDLAQLRQGKASFALFQLYYMPILKALSIQINLLYCNIAIFVQNKPQSPPSILAGFC